MIAVSEAPERRFLRAHLAAAVAFHDESFLDPRGGFFEVGADSRPAADPERALVSCCRLVICHAIGHLHFAKPGNLVAVRHGLRFLREQHRDPVTGGYAWTVNGAAADRTQRLYGLAFVALAYAWALKCGVTEAKAWLYEVNALMTDRFWQRDFGLYADQDDANGVRDPYRGQNSNMHACESMIVAWEATGDRQFLSRAEIVADRVVNGLGGLTRGLIWEHFDAHWRPDFDYNRNVTTDRYRPWGYQPGHQAEWAKLLLVLDRYSPQSWREPRAIELFDRALDLGWDADFGGVYYTCGLDGNVVDAEKHGWVQAEVLAAAGLLAQRSGDEWHSEWFARLWDHALKHAVDPDNGTWYRTLARDHSKPADGRAHKGKTAYHAAVACHLLLEPATALRD